MTEVSIVMYRYSGKKFGISIKSECEECEINSGILADMQTQEFASKPVSVEIKPWLTYLFESLKFGGWHAPVIVVNGKLFSQGKVLDRQKLALRVSALLNRP